MVNDDTKTISNYYRNSFRREQRKLNRNKETKTVQLLNQRFKTNRNAIWRSTSQRSDKQQIIDINLNTLVTHYNSIIGQEYENNAVEEEVEQEIKRISNINGDVIVTYKQVDQLLDALKTNKAAGPSQITNEMFKFAERSRMVKIIQCILETVINKHIFPQMLNRGLLFPLLKDNQGSCSDIKNTRPITLSDTIDILIELNILDELVTRIQTHPLQFGFCKDASTQLAIFTLKEVITHNIALRKLIYVVLLDFSQAFDGVNKYKLLKKLKGKINEHIWVLLANYCKQASIIVRNGGDISDRIEAKTGVKQGGPASPKLFAVYIDDLIAQLINTDKLAKVDSANAGVICYADDLTIIGNDCDGMQYCLNIIYEYCKEADIKINTNKTKWMLFGTQYQRTKHANDTLFIGAESLERVNKFKYLGYWIQENRKETIHLEKRTANMIRRSYGLNKVGYNNISLDIKLRSLLHNTYNRPILLYGIENVQLRATQLLKLKTTENLIIKRSLSLSKYVSTKRLLAALEIVELDRVISIRKLNFTNQVMKNTTTRAVAVAMLSSLNNDSVIKANLEKHIVEEDIKNLEKEDNIYRLLEKVNLEVAKLEDMRQEEEYITEAIRYLLMNRNIENNMLLDTMLGRRTSEQTRS